VRLVYIAGAYRAPTPWGVEQNIRAAEDLAVKVHAAGMFAVCPHANARHMEGGDITDAHMLAGTLELMRRCDAVILVSNWRTSSGALAEVAEATRIGIPVFGRAQTEHNDGGALDGLIRWSRGEA
jgi:nucleoside 2-deoxyribosyltransferase